jgi:hypothetical protein
LLQAWINPFIQLCADGRIILKWIFRKLVGGMDWIDLAQDRDTWRAVVKVVMRGISRPGEELLLYGDGLCSMSWGSQFGCNVRVPGYGDVNRTVILEHCVYRVNWSTAYTEW